MKHVRYPKENVAATDDLLTDSVIKRRDAAFPVGAAAGTRYPAGGVATVYR
ncbi:MAG TPA: hypothetical protein VFQ38_04170 [Longimicrobiales bacterium]|nr:hypothetical protein [Longimicrobiales bacterium]